MYSCKKEEFEKRIQELISEEFIREFLSKKDEEVKNEQDYIEKRIFNKGPDIYFYQRVVSQTRDASPERIKTLLLDKQFVELLYATLTSWGMHSRGAGMKSFTAFSRSIRKNISLFSQLAGCHLENGLNDSIVKPLLELFSSLDIMRSRKKANKEASKLVANSKLMHFILPNLVMPIDRTHTVEFFKGCGRVRLPPHMPENWHRLDEENKSDVRTFFRIHQTVSEIIQKQEILTELRALIDNEWNQTIPKVIDNLIIYYVETRCKKK